MTQPTRLKNSWYNMMSRCYNPKNAAYRNYGGRGIKVCEEWHSYENFKRDMKPMPKGKTLDRIDNDGNYCKENCRWATMKEQRANQRDRVTFEWLGFEKSVLEWAEFLGIPNYDFYKFKNRLQAGLTIPEAICYTRMADYGSYSGRK